MPKNRSGDTGGETVGARIRAARLNKKLTQSQLARPDFSISYISAIERGQIQPSLRAIEIIAQRLDLPSSYFFSAAPPSGQEEARVPSNGGGYNHAEAMQAQIEYTILEARVLLKEGQAEEAIDLLERLRTQAHDTRMHMRLHCLLGCAYLAAGRLDDSELALIEAEKIAARNNDTYASLLIHLRLGQGYIARQQINRAINEYEQALELLTQQQTPEPVWLCHVYYTLGTLYSWLGDDEKSLAMFKEAARVAGNLVQPDYIRGSLQRLSQYFAGAGYPRRALLYAHKSLLESSWHIDPALLIHLYLDLGKAMTQGNHVEARAWLEEALARSRCPQGRAAIHIALAGWERAQGQIELAQQQAQQAAELVSPLDDSLITAEAEYQQGRIAYAQDRLQEGFNLCAAAIDTFQRLNIPREVIDHSEEFAQLLEQHSQSREALHYMKLAYQTRAQLGM